jgi:hypothetical protein
MCRSRAPECLRDWRCRRVAGADGRTARHLKLAGLRKYGRSDGLALRSADLISSDPASRRQRDDLSMNTPDADEADFPIAPGLPMARLPDTGQWAHHAALLGGGLVSTALGERPTPELRAERLTTCIVHSQELIQVRVEKGLGAGRERPQARVHRGVARLSHQKADQIEPYLRRLLQSMSRAATTSSRLLVQPGQLGSVGTHLLHGVVPAPISEARSVSTRTASPGCATSAAIAPAR